MSSLYRNIEKLQQALNQDAILNTLYMQKIFANERLPIKVIFYNDGRIETRFADDCMNAWLINQDKLIEERIKEIKSKYHI